MRFCSNRFAGAVLFAAAVFALSACRAETESANVAPKENPVAKQFTPLRISDLNANAAEPAMAADGNGGVYVVYVEHGADRSADVYLQKYDANNEISGEKTRVNPEKGQAKAWFGDPPTVKTGGDGAIYVGWTARVNGAEKSGANNLYLSVSRDGGKSFGAPVKVNDDAAPAAHGMHSLAIGADNRVYLAWLDERNIKPATRAAMYEEDSPAREPEFVFIKAHHNSNQNNTAKPEKPTIEKLAAENENAEPNSETFFAVSADGGKTFAPNVKLSSEVCPCCKTALLVAPDGKIFVSWRQVLPGDYRHIAVASSADGGGKFSAPNIVSDDRWQLAACPVSGAPLTLFPDNSLKTAWFTAGNAGRQGIYLAESKDAGKTFAPRTLLNENAASGTPILLAERENVARVIWSESGAVWTARFENGKTNDGERREVGTGEHPAAIVSGGKLYVASVRKDKDKQSVWLTLVKE